jgi:hypothetical protein
MHVVDAQRDVREVYVGGFYGQLVSAGLWLVAAAAATWASLGAGVVTLVVGGILIFPLTTLALKLSGGPAALPPGHPMRALAMQIAFTVPLGLLVAVAVAGPHPEWFFPASMIIVGAHYLPFVFLYGMPLFTVLATVLTFGGVALALWLPGPPATGGWVTGATLVLFAFLLRRRVR